MAKAKDAEGMRVTIERSALLRMLVTVTKAVETRNTIPILANVLITADPASLTVRATDLDIEITSSAPADCVSGSTTVPAKMLLDIVRKFPEGAEVRMELDGATLVVKAGRSRFQVPTLPADTFPAISQGGFGEPFTTDLAALFGHVAFAISDDASRYYLNGIYLHTVDARLRAVATDGHRLARVDGDALAQTMTGVIVPKKTVTMVPLGEVQVELSDKRVRVTSGQTVLVSKLIEGTFPDYDRITPKNNDIIATVDRASLMAAVDRVSVVASERGGRAVKFVSAPDSVTLSTTNPDGGSASEDVESEGADMTVGSNVGYLADMLRQLGGATARFAWSDAGGPTVMTGDNENWLGILMPMRVA